MQTVKHKIYGTGEVIEKEVKSNSTNITVKFEGGKEARFSIPESFTVGALVAQGSLKEEVDAAIAERKAQEQERLQRAAAPSVTPQSPAPSGKHGRKPTAAITVKGSIETAFEEYLVNAGYKWETDSGSPSTVFSYTNGVKKVLEEEGISWNTLQRDIEDIIPVYDVGGAKEHIGAKSNKTVINALKRFGEFVNG